MTEAATKLSVKTEEKKAEPTSALREWRPFEALHREIDRLFDDFGAGFWRSSFRRSMFDIEPFWRRQLSWEMAPAMDIAETEKAYEITAELPGMSESDVEVGTSNGMLTMKGEKSRRRKRRRSGRSEDFGTSPFLGSSRTNRYLPILGGGAGGKEQ